jgi:hypothetical protein
VQLIAWWIFRLRIILLCCKNALDYYNFGIVAVNSKVIALAPRAGIHYGNGVGENIF